jgi:hypothetical protein
MLHHFGDMLDREGDYWTVVPNRERHAYRIGDLPEGSEEITILTVGKADEHWARLFTFPNLIELTLHEPTAEQLEAIGRLHGIKRLRITHARPKAIDFLGTMLGVEELVLEYVSGFSDLSPLRSLPRLRALHMENLRRVSQFGGLSGIGTLRHLSIYGTLDWKQPIDDFEFLRGLPNLEVLAMWQMICKKTYPALLPAIGLKNLKKLKVHGSYLDTEEYALVEECFSGREMQVDGANWGPYKKVAATQIPLPSNDIRTHLSVDVIKAQYPEVTICFDGRRLIDDPDSYWFEFTGKGAGRIKCGTAKANGKCVEAEKRYEAMKQAARLLIDEEIKKLASAPI